MPPRHTRARSEKLTLVIHFLTLCGHLLVKVYLGVEAVMAHVINELLLHCCLAAFVTGIVIAAASSIS